MTNFVLIGAAGYVAPRHMKAIRDCGGNLLAVMDPHDSVGVLDQYFPRARYFSEFERFDRFCYGKDINYVSICSPNYLHDAHCRFAMRIGADAICEKPLVLKTHNLDKLREFEDVTYRRIWCILQLRLNKKVHEIKQYVKETESGWAELIYQTPRGNWYDFSWKSDDSKSGGMVTNIGIHLFDLLIWLFGKEYEIVEWNNSTRMCRGFIKSGKFSISVVLNTTHGIEAKRALTVNGRSFELSNGFENAHTKCYHEILENRGFGIEDVRDSIRMCEQLRSWNN